MSKVQNLHMKKPVARNEMESGFEKGVSKLKSTPFNRKVKLKTRNEMESGFEKGVSKLKSTPFNRKVKLKKGNLP